MSTSGISLSFGANVAWIACCAFYYGYNISALNALQGSITCPSNGQAQAGLLPECVPMTVTSGIHLVSRILLKDLLRPMLLAL